MFAPKAVRFSLGFTSESYHYQTEILPYPHTVNEQVYRLGPQALVATYLRIDFYGKYQIQEVDNLYYTCMRCISATGLPLGLILPLTLPFSSLPLATVESPELSDALLSLAAHQLAFLRRIRMDMDAALLETGESLLLFSILILLSPGQLFPTVYALLEEGRVEEADEIFPSFLPLLRHLLENAPTVNVDEQRTVKEQVLPSPPLLSSFHPLLLILSFSSSPFSFSHLTPQALLLVGLILALGSDLPLPLWAGILPPSCTFWLASPLDVAPLFQGLGALFLFLFLRLEFQRNKEETVWRIVSERTDYFDFRDF